MIRGLAWPEYHPWEALKLLAIVCPCAWIGLTVGENVWRAYQPISVHIQQVAVQNGELHVEATSSALAACDRISDFVLFNYNPYAPPAEPFKRIEHNLGTVLDGTPYPPAGGRFQPPDMAVPGILHGRQWLVIRQAYFCWPFGQTTGQFATSPAVPVDLP